MRYLKLYGYFVRHSISKAMEFRIDFFFRILMDVIYYVVNILFFKVIYLHTPMLGGWNEEQMMIFVSIYLLIDAIHMTVFSSNIWWLPFYINKGDLDYYLIRPVSSLYFVSVREFSANSFVNLVIAAGFFIYSLMNYSGDFTFLNFLFLLFLIINGTLLHYTIQVLMILPVFWTHSAKGFIDLFYSLSMAMERPHRIYRGALRVVFTTVLPFALIASFPATLFLEAFKLETFLHLIAISVMMWVLVLFIWSKGLKAYSSASS